MTLQRVKFLLLSRISRGLLGLQNSVLAALLKGYQRNNLTSSHLVERVEHLKQKQLLSPPLRASLLLSRPHRNNSNYSLKPRRGLPMSIQHLSNKEIEQAFEVVDAAWQAPAGSEVEVQIPEHLQHLSPEDWEHVSRALFLLQHQQAVSVLH